MTVKDAERLLAGALARNPGGRFDFACEKATVALQLRGRAACVHFSRRDRVGFRAEPEGLEVENAKTGDIVRRFPWSTLEWLAAGEPEMADGSLFQG